ncbi:hypothetical protein JCM8547_008011 [Rhodosporidiobolus lusitaniae]
MRSFTAFLLMGVAASTTALAISDSSTITAGPSATQIAKAKRAESSALPLTEYTYSYDAVPYQVNPYNSGRGPQSGVNQCNSSTVTADSQCQTLVANNMSDFCIWGSPTTNETSTIGDIEAAVVSYCTNDKWGGRVIPAGAITGLQLMHTSEYTQWTGRFDMTALGLAADDTGGELDPHGADLAGNPLGGLVYSTGLPGGDNSTLQQVIEWTQFVGSGIFCLKLCKSDTMDDPFYCQNKYDLLGCNYNMPAAYEDKVFLECEGELQDVVGTYTDSAGATQTWSQPTELAADTTLPWTPRIPSSSNCKTYQSTDLFPATLLAYQSTSAPTSTSGSSSGSQSGSSGSAAQTGGSAASADGASGASSDLVAFSALFSAIAVLLGAVVALA